MATEACGGEISLRIKNLAIKKEVVFSQIKMTGFSDTVTPSWNEEAVYGRMDRIATYQGTTRAIDLSFELGPFSESDDRKKLALEKISRLMQFQYPTYSGTGDATAISRPPLLQINFHNYIREGLVCYVTDISYKPVDGMNAITVPKFVDGKILPQRISVSLSIKVLHTVAPGFSDDGVWSGAPVGPADTAAGVAQAAADAVADAAAAEKTAAEQAAADEEALDAAATAEK